MLIKKVKKWIFGTKMAGGEKEKNGVDLKRKLSLEKEGRSKAEGE